MIVGYLISAYPGKKFENNLEELAKNFKAVEIMLDQTLISSKINWKEAADIISSFEFKNITAHATFFDVNLASMNAGITEESVRQIKTDMQRATQLGAKSLTVHSPQYSGGFKQEAYWKRMVTSFRELVKEAKQLGLVIGLENDWWGKPIVRTAQEAKKVIDAIKSKSLGVTLDITHAYKIGPAEPARFIKNLLPHIVDAHICGLKDGKEVPLCESDIKFVRVLRLLKYSGYAGPLILEHGSIEQALRGKQAIEKRLC